MTSPPPTASSGEPPSLTHLHPIGFFWHMWEAAPSFGWISPVPSQPCPPLLVLYQPSLTCSHLSLLRNLTFTPHSGYHCPPSLSCCSKCCPYWLSALPMHHCPLQPALPPQRCLSVVSTWGWRPKAALHPLFCGACPGCSSLNPQDSTTLFPLPSATSQCSVSSALSLARLTSS